MAEPHPHFRLAGIPVRIEWSFWLIALFLGYGARTGWLLVAWVAIVLVSILVHELGHAVALRVYHQQPHVVLHAFGGLTYGSGAYRSRVQSIVVSAAGPLTALFLLGIPAYLYLQSFDLYDQYVHHDLYVVVNDVAWVNIAWSIVNLLPILPLDGGNIASSIFGRATARILSMLVAVGAASYFFQIENQFAGFFMMMFALMNFASLQQERAGQRPSVPAPQARFASLDVPGVRTQSSDAFGPGTAALAQGRLTDGVDLLAAGYRKQPSGPTTLAPAQEVARSGQTVSLADRLLGRGGAGPAAASNLQSLLHYAGCFAESAIVGALVYTDGRASRAQTAFEVACSTARTGDNDRAMAWLQRAIEDGFTAGALLDGEPDLASLRLRPDWQALRARAG